MLTVTPLWVRPGRGAKNAKGNLLIGILVLTACSPAPTLVPGTPVRPSQLPALATLRPPDSAANQRPAPTGLGLRCALSSSQGLIWPLCSPESPLLSSPFGPRQKASAGYTYEFHEGLDIPTPLGSPIYAVEDGVVTIAGQDPGYASTVVQVQHEGNPPFFSNYLHVQIPPPVTRGQEVHQGEVIAYSGESESGFAHLHFEIRQGRRDQRHAVNPYRYLPYADSGPPQLTLLGIDTTDSEGSGARTSNWRVAVEAGTLQQEVDLARVSLETQPGVTRTVDLEAVNLAWQETITNPIQAEACLQPARFNVHSQVARLDVSFVDVAAGPVLWAKAIDIHGNVQAVDWPAAPSPLALSPGQSTEQTRAATQATFTHRLVNRLPIAQVFTIATRSAQGWPYGTNLDQATLGPGEETNLRLSVDVPPGAPHGSIDCLTVLVSAAGETVARGVAVDKVVVEGE